MNCCIFRGKMYLFHRTDFCGSIDTIRQVRLEVVEHFELMENAAEAACGEFDDITGELIAVQWSLVGLIRWALKWCISDEGVINRNLVELFTHIESYYFVKVPQLLQPPDKEAIREKVAVKMNHFFKSLLPKILDAFSVIMETSAPDIYTSSVDSVMEHLMDAIDDPGVIHKMHEKLCISLRKLAKFVKDSNDWECIFPLLEDHFDRILWYYFCDTWKLFMPGHKVSNFINRSDSAIRCRSLHIWVLQSSRSPNFNHDFLEAYVECIQQHLTWFSEEQRCLLTGKAKDEINIMQDLLRLVLSLCSHMPEHGSNWQILSRTIMHVYPALMRLGASVQSFTLKGLIDGETVSSFEIYDWFTRIFEALFLPLDTDIYLSSETLIQYAYYYRHLLLQISTHGDTREINSVEDQSKFGEDLLFVARVVFFEWSEHLIEREMLVNDRVRMVGVLRSLGSIICSSLNNTLPIKNHPGLPDLLAKFELVRVQSARKISLHFSKDLSTQVPVPNLLVFINIVCEKLEELQICNPDLVRDWNGELQTILNHLVFIRSYLQNIRVDSITDTGSQDLTIRIANAVCNIKYLIDAFVSGALYASWGSFLIYDLIERCGLIEECIIKDSSNVLLPTTNLQKDAICTSSRVSIPQIDTVVGFEVVMKGMVERLTSSSKQREVIPVVGMAGIGKTTLAKKVYEDPTMVKHFDLRAWCCVSQEYTKKDLLLQLLGTGVNRQESIVDLEVEFHKKLCGRRYLVVLDDVWNIDAYDYLQCFCPDDGKGSRIVFTSRFLSIGDHSNCLQLDLLSNHDSWNLFKQKIFFDEEIPWELYGIGKQISKKCGGLPLAIVVVAGILTKLQKEEGAWKEVLEKLCVYIADDGEGRRMKALDLSYELLPDHLKPLFLYIGAFPEDHSIHVTKLQQFWIAEGFIRKTTKGTLEAEAEGYLMDLIDRSLVMVRERKANGLVKSCGVHDLIRDMCIAKAKAEGFMEHTSLLNNHLAEDLIYQRRVSVSWARNKDKLDRTPSSSTADETQPRARITHDDLSRLSIPTRLHSLLLIGGTGTGCELSEIVGDQSNFENHKMLRVFHIGGVKIPDDWSTSMTLPLNLRYISLQLSSSDRIPASLFSLWNLETMIILLDGNKEITVPGEVWKMTKLQHLQVDWKYKVGGFIFSQASEEMYSCSKLENLQRLSTPIFFNREETSKLIGRFPNLVNLRCCLSNGNGTEFPYLECLHQLQSLSLRWCGEGPCKQPQLSRLPSTVKKLTLRGFYFKWNDISNIPQVLPNLEILKLQSDAVEDEVWDMEDGVFPKLKVLKLSEVNIKRWIASEENFPCLENLVLDECYYLEEIPSGFSEINTLEKIQMLDCSHSASESAKQIQQEVQGFGNDLKVSISSRLALILHKTNRKLYRLWK